MANKLVIPKTFELARVKCEVQIKDFLDNNYLGYNYTSHGIIELAKTSYNKSVPDDKIANTFYHELVHRILRTAEYDKLSEDETFVTAMGNLLMEFDLTRSGILDISNE